MTLRKGKTKSILEASIDSALLAVEIYNKPRTSFRSEGFITMMIMAWTRLFHAHFNATIGQKYYYKKKNGRYEVIDGERKAWELSTCIKKYASLTKGVESNLSFFIRLRNKIEHRHIEKREVDTLIFGECQSLLFNYESQLIDFFGNEYSINEALVYSLQFSQIRTKKQEQANKAALSKDLSELVAFVQKYRNTLDADTYNSREYSIRLIQIPKISNTNRGDAAVEFVQWDCLSDDDKAAYEKLNVIIKDKTVKIEAANVGRLKPSEVVKKVNDGLKGKEITMPLHVVLYKLFRIRPANGSDDPFDTNAEFCLYDEPHNDYVYQDAWVTFLIHFLQTTDFEPSELRAKEQQGEKLDISKYLI
ncbi:DUF3644 domain-containing protein [Pseudoalteromonas piscicida]|uniref:DUF3644 domain-containing protein n=1 Tax=Pseudoalteromonas piscicida TaxID=43662 RepID=A0A2A5JWJ2_PSEO7|nr:DUF3644 domain-containing protein [Pseudoalteromonas piscicida]PCK33691.1 hypothetical protein CEX98_00670 [Pseudoalteromonas piscicida]